MERPTRRRWKPASAVDPDPEADPPYRPLAEVLPEVAAELEEVWLDSWVSAGRRVPVTGRREEGRGSMELSVQREDEDHWRGGPLWTLRATSWISGVTAWLWGWDGSADAARRWVRQQGADAAGSRGQMQLDDRWAAEEAQRQREPGCANGDMERAPTADRQIDQGGSASAEDDRRGARNRPGNRPG